MPTAPQPGTTTAVVVHGANDLRVEQVVLPDPAPGQAVVAVTYGGVCGSDLHYWRDGAVGESILRAPMVLGHEIVGVVARAAADGSGPPAGTPVAVHPAPASPPTYASRRTGRTCRRASATSARPRACRTRRARSPARSTWTARCCGRSPPTSIFVRPR
jgi:threonine dehydrogenase-like Zn-dependent dehydrogenase